VGRIPQATSVSTRKKGKVPRGPGNLHIDDRGRGVGHSNRIRRMMRKSKPVDCEGMTVRQKPRSDLARVQRTRRLDIRGSKCTECGKELGKGDFFHGGKNRCLSFAISDHLITPSCDAALTVVLRSTAHCQPCCSSADHVAVRTRKASWYRSCAARADTRMPWMPSSVRDARRDECGELKDDRKLAATLQKRLKRLWLSRGEARAIAAHTAVRGSESGGSRARRARFETEALTAA